MYCGRYGTGSTLDNPTRNWRINQTRSDTRLVMLMLVIIGPPLLIILGTALSRNPLSKYKHGKWYQTREITDNDEVSKRPTVTDPVNWFPTWKLIFRWGEYPNWIVNGMLRYKKPRAWSRDTIQGNYFELEAFFYPDTIQMDCLKLAMAVNVPFFSLISRFIVRTCESWRSPWTFPSSYAHVNLICFFLTFLISLSRY